MMMKLFGTILILAVLAFAGGFVFFAAWDMPYASQQVEKRLPNEQFFEASEHAQE